MNYAMTMMMMLMWIVRIDNGEYQTYRRRPFHSRLLDQPRLKAGAKVLIYPTIETPGKSGNPREKIVKEIRYYILFQPIPKLRDQEYPNASNLYMLYQLCFNFFFFCVFPYLKNEEKRAVMLERLLY